MTPSQMRMARAALGWGVRDLAEKSGVAANTVTRIENGADAKQSTIDAMRSTFEAAGIEFIPENGGGVGIRFRERQGSERVVSPARSPKPAKPLHTSEAERFGAEMAAKRERGEALTGDELATETAVQAERDAIRKLRGQ